MKKIFAIIAVAIFAVTLTACRDNNRKTVDKKRADVVSKTLVDDSFNFEIAQRIVSYNDRSGKHILTIEGKCAITHHDDFLEVVCKNGKNKYKNHYIGLTDNVTFFITPLDFQDVNDGDYKVTWNPALKDTHD